MVLIASQPGARGPANITVVGGYIYWTNELSNTISRANLDGSDVNENFITGANTPDAIAVVGRHIYWTNIAPHVFSVGRANLDGTHVNQRFVKRLDAQAMAAKGGFIYGVSFDYIWRMRLNGRDLNRHFIRVTIAGDDGIAVT
jgi:virginiamycin B lyase